MTDLSQIFKALSDTNRLRILKMLEERPLCVCEIQTVLSLATSTVSKHLSILRDAGLIYDEKVNKWVNYHLNRQSTNNVIKVLLPLLSTWMPQDDSTQSDLQTVRSVDRNQLCKVQLTKETIR